MLSGNPISRGTGRNEAADWRNWLANDPRLTPGRRENYRRTLTSFEEFCLRRGTRGSAGGANPCPGAADGGLGAGVCRTAAPGASPRAGPTAGVEGGAQLAVPVSPVPAGGGADGGAGAGPGRPGAYALGAAVGGEDPGAASLVADGAGVSGLGVAAG